MPRTARVSPRIAKPLPCCIDLFLSRLTECSETAVLQIHPKGLKREPNIDIGALSLFRRGLSCANSPGPVADDPVPIARRVA